MEWNGIGHTCIAWRGKNQATKEILLRYKKFRIHLATNVHASIKQTTFVVTQCSICK